MDTYNELLTDNLYYNEIPMERDLETNKEHKEYKSMGDSLADEGLF